VTAQTVTFGSGSTNSFSALGAGTDYVSNWTISDDVTTNEAPLTGSLGASDRIVDLTSLKLYWWADANPTTTDIQFQIALANSGANGYQSANTNANGADTTVATELRRTRTSTVYYGFQKQDTGNVRFSTYTSSGNYVYVDGSTSTYPNRRLRGQITVESVPNSPTSLTSSSVNAVAVTLTWTIPTDLGTAAGINGYRVLQKPNALANTNANWSVATVSGQASLGDTGSSANTATVTGLKPGTSYDFMVAALNSVTDSLLTDNTQSYSNTIAHTGTLSSVYTVRTTGGVYDGTNWVTPIPTVYLDFPLASGTTYTANSITSSVVITYPVGNTVPFSSGQVATITTGVSNIDTANVSITTNTTARTISYNKSVSNGSGSITGNVTAWVNANVQVYNGSTWLNLNFD
jgi:Fibronectin type III domain